MNKKFHHVFFNSVEIMVRNDEVEYIRWWYYFNNMFVVKHTPEYKPDFKRHDIVINKLQTYN